MTFEALFINQLKSELKSRDEFKRRVLVSLALAFVKISLDLCQVIEAIYVYILKNFTELHRLKLNTEMFYSTFVIILSFASFFTSLENFSCFFCTKFNKKWFSPSWNNVFLRSFWKSESVSQSFTFWETMFLQFFRLIDKCCIFRFNDRFRSVEKTKIYFKI